MRKPSPPWGLVNRSEETDPRIRVLGNLVLKLGLGRTCESRFCCQGALRSAAPAGDARAGRRRCPPDETRTPRRGGACGARWRRPRSCARSLGCWPLPGCRAALQHGPSSMSGSRKMPNLTGRKLGWPWAPRFSCGFISSNNIMKTFWSIKEEMDWNKLWQC